MPQYALRVRDEFLGLPKIIELMPNYNFETLSGNEFEILVRDLLQAELGVVLESFKSGRDKGIDLRYAPSQENSLIVQCKHYVGSGITKLKADLKKHESPKVKKLSPKRYIIATSVGLSPSDKDEILEMFPSCTSTSDIYGRDDLNNLLARHSHIELTHYKLWLSSTHILESLLKSATINRTRLDLERIHGKLKYYVQNASFTRAKEILIQQLTLRSQLNGLEFPQSSEGRLDGAQIQFGLERKVIEFGVAFEQFEFDITAQSRKEMIGLSRHRLGG